jgi:hypothetical protein
MNENTNQGSGSSARPYIWLAGAIGTAAGLASLAYSRRKQTRWDKARSAVLQAAETGRKEFKPWMGAAASAAAGCVALAYRKANRPSKWEQVNRDIGKQWKQLKPWMGVAANAAGIAVTAAYSRKSRTAAKNGVNAAAGSAVDAGKRIVNRIRTISQQTRDLYPQVRKMLA